jgi:hypothetical protein
MNSLRPLRINDASGDVYMANGQVYVRHSDGAVGIGTASPSNQLTLYSGSTNAYFNINAPLANQSSIQFSDITNGADWVAYRVDGPRDFSLWNPTVGNVMHLTQAGNVGIGTTNPASKLDVSGGNIQIDASSGEGLYLYRAGGNANDIRLNTSNGTPRCADDRKQRTECGTNSLRGLRRQRVSGSRWHLEYD